MKKRTGIMGWKIIKTSKSGTGIIFVELCETQEQPEVTMAQINQILLLALRDSSCVETSVNFNFYQTSTSHVRLGEKLLRKQ